MNQEGNFAAAILASDDGLPVAAVPTPSPYDPDTIAAMMTMVKDFITQMQTRPGIAEVDKVVILVYELNKCQPPLSRNAKAGVLF